MLAALLLAIGAAACGGGDDDGGGDSGDVPSGAVATVGGVEISEEELDTQVAALARAQRGGSGGGTTPASGDAGSDDSTDGGDGGDELEPAVRKQLESQALSTLLMRQALEQEAEDRDIKVSDDEVRERWEAASQGQFKTQKALRRFLGGQTEDDLLAQLRLQVLTERIHEQVSEKAGGGKQGAKAVKQFQKDFQKRWQDRTACRDGFTAVGCADDSK
ncbi:MAG: SurA N-terminal domain-containing protein [Actinomycetota bacterium]|nr:SurA N-terminal domain-containing protein [Actinomycetota bacterium]